MAQIVIGISGMKAQAGVFDTELQTLQAVELMAGAVNITLLPLNMRGGFRMVGKFCTRPA